MCISHQIPGPHSNAHVLGVTPVCIPQLVSDHTVPVWPWVEKGQGTCTPSYCQAGPRLAFIPPACRQWGAGLGSRSPHLCSTCSVLLLKPRRGQEMLVTVSYHCHAWRVEEVAEVHPSHSSDPGRSGSYLTGASVGPVASCEVGAMGPTQLGWHSQ